MAYAKVKYNIDPMVFNKRFYNKNKFFFHQARMRPFRARVPQPGGAGVLRRRTEQPTPDPPADQPVAGSSTASPSGRVRQQLQKVAELNAKGYWNINSNQRALLHAKGLLKDAEIILQGEQKKEDGFVRELKQKGITLEEKLMRVALRLTRNNMTESLRMLQVEMRDCDDLRDMPGASGEQAKGRADVSRNSILFCSL